MQRYIVHLPRSLVVAVLVAGLAGFGCASSGGDDTSEDAEASSPPPTDRDGPETRSRDRESESAGESDRPPAGEKEPTGDDRSAAADGSRERISDEKLDQFAEVSRQMQTIQADTQQKIRGAESRQEAEMHQREAQRKVQGVFDNSEMTRREYEQIAQRLRSDRELQQRYKQRVEGGG